MAAPKNRRRQSGRRGGKQPSNFGWYLVIACAIAIIGGGFFWAERMKKQGQIDTVTLCPTTGPLGAKAVLLDLTDPITVSQAKRLRAMLDSEIATAPSGTIISVGLVSAEEDNWGAKFSRCKPQNKSDASALTQNPQLIGERYNDEFLVPLSEALDLMIGGNPENSSPIMESLQALVADTDGFAAIKGPRRLIIVSDLLQHSETLSFYRGDDWEGFKLSANYQRLAKNLDDVDVTLIRVPRSSTKVEPASVDTFWARYFDTQGTNARFRILTLGDL